MSLETSGTAGIKRYSLSELHAISADEPHAVRDEVVRRHTIAAKKLDKLQKEVTALEALAKKVM